MYLNCMEFRILDLFSGAGGFSCGLESIPNFKTVIAVDFDKYVLETFSKNFIDAQIICGDITSQKIKDSIINSAKEKKVNMIIGGPPCQGFSLKGKNLGINDPRNFLFREYIEIVKAIKPKIFIIENVKNLINAANGYFIEEIQKQFKKIGYIINYGILNAKNFGVPQNRERTIIIGSLDKSINLPVSSGKKLVTVKDAIEDLAYLNSGEGEFVSEYLNKPSSTYQTLMRKNSTKLFNHIATKHSEIALKKLSYIPPEGDKSNLPKKLQGKQKFSTTWSRLIWNNQSPTIDTRFDTPSNGRNSHPILNRAITPREAARLQSFPDTFIFYGKKCSICKQIGNAVPPLLARAIGKQIIDVYSNESFTDKNYNIVNTDCNFFVKELLNKNIKVDAIITDPPYNISKKNNFSTLNLPRKGVDFGEWDKEFDVCSWINDYSKLVSKDGSIIVFCSYLFISYIVRTLETNNFEVKDIIVWRKSNPMPRNIDRRYVQDMEFAIWSVRKGSKWTFNKDSKKPYLRAFVETPTVLGKERTEHPTQKSLKLMEEIIKIHTNKGDTILDPFMGSGTTGVACLKNDRRFIGIELSKKYYDIANDRLHDIKK